MSFTIDEWCRHRRVGKWKLYELWRQDRGPRFHLIGARRLISEEADADWVRQQEQLTESPEVGAAIKRAREKARAMVAKRVVA